MSDTDSSNMFFASQRLRDIAHQMQRLADETYDIETAYDLKCNQVLERDAQLKEKAERIGALTADLRAMESRAGFLSQKLQEKNDVVIALTADLQEAAARIGALEARVERLQADLVQKVDELKFVNELHERINDAMKKRAPWWRRVFRGG